MRFEKASQDSWIGWIGFSEVFLLASLMMLSLAAAYDSAFSRSTKSNTELQSDNESLVQENQILKSSKSELENNKANLQKEVAQLDSKNQSLSTTVGSMTKQLADVNQKLKTAHADMKATETRLTRLNRELESGKQKAIELQSKLDLTMAQRAILEERVKSVRIELSNTARKLANAEEKGKELPLLKGKLAALEKRTADLKAELETTMDQKEKVAKQLASAQAQVKSLTIELVGALTLAKTFPKKIEELGKEKKRLQTKIDVLSKGEIAQAAKLKEMFEKLGAKSSEIAKMKIAIEELRTGTGRLRQELLGLKGKMNRVVFLFDRSGSMQNRWEYTSEIVEKWLNYLPVEHCVVLTFGDDVVAFPVDGTMMNMVGDEGKTNRQGLNIWLKRNRPNGLTNTLAAFESAYKYKNVSMIVLFTDGAPRTSNTPSNQTLDVEMRDKIYELVSSNKIPVNTVGLGDFYKNKDLGEFLLKLATDSGGAFLGR